MADSPAFNPPNMQPMDNDPLVIKVTMKEVEWGNRMSQQPPMKEDLPIAHIKTS